MSKTVMVIKTLRGWCECRAAVPESPDCVGGAAEEAGGFLAAVQKSTFVSHSRQVPLL